MNFIGFTWFERGAAVAGGVGYREQNNPWFIPGVSLYFQCCFLSLYPPPSTSQSGTGKTKQRALRTSAHYPMAKIIYSFLSFHFHANNNGGCSGAAYTRSTPPPGRPLSRASTKNTHRIEPPKRRDGNRQFSAGG